MKLTGHNLLGNQFSSKGDKKFNAIDPTNGEKLSPDFIEATVKEVDQAARKAAEAFQEYRETDAFQRADFLECIAQEIEKVGEALIERCHQETGLPEARISGERGRTTNQLKLFAGLLREGSWVNARVDTGDPDRKPIPKPDVRTMQIGHFSHCTPRGSLTLHWEVHPMPFSVSKNKN